MWIEAWLSQNCAKFGAAKDDKRIQIGEYHIVWNLASWGPRCKLIWRKKFHDFNSFFHWFQYPWSWQWDRGHHCHPAVLNIILIIVSIGGVRYFECILENCRNLYVRNSVFVTAILSSISTFFGNVSFYVSYRIGKNLSVFPWNRWFHEFFSKCPTFLFRLHTS